MNAKLIALTGPVSYNSRMATIRYLISACLCGVPCRYDGSARRIERFVRLVESGEAMAVCPEVLGGLSVPREPCEILFGRVVNTKGQDKTEEYALGAQKTLALAEKHNICVAILKERSPSCGTSRIYDGTFNEVLVPGQGITTALLKEKGILVYSEEDAPEEIGAGLNGKTA